mmetsp:Transcript_27816/g.31961  ORF Transcript_27816/g.31961 Transcript_27816/m.31961 type:complete len:237 (-) Transcript_27816:113-823(-)|eukprot:CAMPEP_0114992684 /NCGR_PEP_ID=MMETSP0216-20121206/12088_1 /TAXON_ID=223996 /ORGANISM="Protocruzia adherens, Strain Boccale" /LENGTH=236 /DNA_ID=CAMNT_0002356197 /DNA_START=191 /DNA_END=901 /DNA_ORIENTATION=+
MSEILTNVDNDTDTPETKLKNGEKQLRSKQYDESIDTLSEAIEQKLSLVANEESPEMIEFHFKYADAIVTKMEASFVSSTLSQEDAQTAWECFEVCQTIIDKTLNEGGLSDERRTELMRKKSDIHARVGDMELLRENTDVCYQEYCQARHFIEQVDGACSRSYASISFIMATCLSTVVGKEQEAIGHFEEAKVTLQKVLQTSALSKYEATEVEEYISVIEERVRDIVKSIDGNLPL